jgi:radical SAM-linked protein
MQRLRIKFSRGEELKFLSHLDLMRLWERALRRARIPLAYSQGYAPHPQLSLAAPLAVGITSEAELMDIHLSRWITPQFFKAKVTEQLPQGIKLLEVWQIGLKVPSLQSQVKSAEYRVEIETERTAAEVQQSLDALLKTEKLPWQHMRDTGPRHYDLRALIQDLWLIEHRDSLCVLGMRLRCDEHGSGRPEQVTKALGFTKFPKSIHRTALLFD